jgi:probable phosphoglycerate mutase
MCLLRRPTDGTSPLHTDVDRQSVCSNPADRSDPQERPPTCLSINPPLNELGYGAFEGAPFLDYAARLQHNGPWIRLPEAGESHREGIRRMILGLVAALEQPGPRIVIAHGLLLSVLGWHMARTPSAAMPPFFLEALHLVPLAMLGDHLADRASSLLEELDAQVHPDQPAPADSLIFGAGTAPILATFDSLSTPLEETLHA